MTWQQQHEPNLICLLLRKGDKLALFTLYDFLLSYYLPSSSVQSPTYEYTLSYVAYSIAIAQHTRSIAWRAHRPETNQHFVHFTRELLLSKSRRIGKGEIFMACLFLYRILFTFQFEWEFSFRNSRHTHSQLENPISFSPVAVTRGLTLKTLKTQATQLPKPISSPLVILHMKKSFSKTYSFLFFIKRSY